MGAKIQPSSYGVPAIIVPPRSGSRALVDPTKYGWSWLNQGVATITARGPAFYMASPLEVADNWHFYAKSVPAKPYSIIVHQIPTLVNVSYMGVAVGWLQSSNNHFAVCDQRVGVIESSLSGSPWGLTGNYQVNSGQLVGMNWVKLTDDVTNRRIYISTDGITWVLYHSAATNLDITPDRLVFGMESRNGTYGTALTIDSWEELAGS